MTIFLRVAALLLFMCAGTYPPSVQILPAADHHAHLQSPKAARLLNEGAALHSEEASPEKEKAYTAKDLISALDAAGVRRATALSEAYLLGTRFVHVADEAEVVDQENDWTLQQVRRYPKRLVGFCSVNPIRPYAMAAIKHCGHIGLRGGLKLHLAASRFEFGKPDDVRQLQDVFREANRLRMPVLIHLHPDDNSWDGRRDALIFMEQVLPLAKDIPVQIAHLSGWGGYDRSADAALSAFADQCVSQPAACDRLYFDISAVIVPPSAATAPKGSDLRFMYENQKDFSEGPARLATNLRRIGLKKILFATDWPIFSQKEYIELLRAQLPVTPAEIDQVFRNVAPYF
ncbi:MAG TPA: amidohydrolase family protein [Terriglobales bacterium]|jgi:predicted TIM-barrel fold metal-dependent hydrolase|nr:amidohydrolase family protein [Terriglobales bacterium]